MGWSMDQVHGEVHGLRSMFCIRPRAGDFLISLPSPLPSLSSHFPVNFASVVCLRHFGTCARKIVESRVYRNFKGLFFVFKRIEPATFLDLGHELTFFTFCLSEPRGEMWRRVCWQPDRVFIGLSLDEGKRVNCFAAWLPYSLIR